MQTCAAAGAEREDKGVPGGAGGFGGAWQLCKGQAVQAEGGHGEHESWWGGCSAGGGDAHGWHMSAGVSEPFRVQRAVPGGRREQPWADSHGGGPPEQRVSPAVVWLGQGRPQVSEGCSHLWDNKG